MAKTRSISYSYGHTVQKVQFEPVRVDVTEVIDLEEGDNYEEQRTKLRNRVIMAVEKDLEVLCPKVK